jgi:hypothetical protein
MTTATPARGSLRELARRANGCVEVALFWEPTTDELTVCVADETHDSYFELHPTPEHALDCFYHPYSYAAAEPDLLAA